MLAAPAVARHLSSVTGGGGGTATAADGRPADRAVVATVAVLAILVVRLITDRALRTPPIPAFGPWQGPAVPGAPAPFQPGYPVAFGPDGGQPPIPGAQPPFGQPGQPQTDPHQWGPRPQQWPPSGPPQP